ncbi:MAG: hypothetical protein QM689_08685 [Oscillospiraceae bacterium]
MSDLMQSLLDLFGLSEAVLNNITNLQTFFPVFIKLLLAVGCIGTIFGFFFSFGNSYMTGRWLK